MPFDRRGLDNRARRTLLWCAAVLCISPLLGGWLVDRCPLPIRDPETRATVLAWEKAKPHPDVLLLGSSRLGSFVRNVELATLSRNLLPHDSGHIFNATLAFGEPIRIEFLTRQLLSSGLPPRLVVMETSPDLLGRNNPFFSFVITRHLTAAALPGYFSDIVLSHTAISRLLSSRLTPFFRHRGELLAYAGEVEGQGDAERTLPADPSEAAGGGNSFQYVRDKGERSPIPPAERMRIAARRFQPYLRHYQLTGATSAAFERTLAMLHARGCAVVLLQPPLSSVQRALFTVEMREAFDAFVQRLRRAYGCEFVDYSQRFADTSFVDSYHASNVGSLRFTELLANEVVAPAWRKLLNQPGD
jgi:hypothetical protein